MVHIILWLSLLFSTSVTAQPDLVAFTVGQNSHVDLTGATTIPFNKNITLHNTGSSLHNGIFTCPNTGYYKFQVFSLTRKDRTLFLGLFKNSELVASLWGHNPNNFAAAGNAVILSLQRGDTVEVRSRDQYIVDLYGAPHEIYTTFTGVQLGSVHGFDNEERLDSFSVTLTHADTVIVGQSVLYDNVLVDTARAYDNNTGIYTAPSEGIYILHFFSLAQSNQQVHQELFHNDDHVCTIYAKTDTDFGDAGNTAILHLYQGDEVTIKARVADNSLYGKRDAIYTSFSGTQLMTASDFTGHGQNKYAFSVGLSNRQTVQNNGKVIFDRVIIDLNHAYDHVTGEFIAPVSGLYEFIYHMLVTQNDTLFVDLYHNYKYVNSVYSYTPNGFGTGGNAAVIDVDAGDSVFLRSINENHLFGSVGDIYCTFSGYLLRPRSSSIVIG